MRAIAMTRLFVVVVAALAINTCTASYTMATGPAITTYGERNARAPDELNLFSFLVGKWNGTGTTRAADGKQVQFELTWIGRYILDGMAIADEFHSLAPDGKPYLGVSLRHFDAKQGSWVVEYLNVSNSFLRRQVNPRSGSVSRDAGAIVVISEDGQSRIREHYRVTDQDHFTYSTDLSGDAGKNWDPVLIEMTMTRAD
jgi:hypothetical protein